MARETNEAGGAADDMPAIVRDMEVVGSDGVRIGLTAEADGNHIRLAPGSTIQGSRASFDRYVPWSLVASVEENQVRLSAKADEATLVELNAHPGAAHTRLEPGDGASGWDWNGIALGAAAMALAAAAVAGALLFWRNKSKLDNP